MADTSRSESSIGKWGLPLATVVLWASAFPAIRAAFDGYGAAELALLRYLVASLTFGLYAMVRGMGMPPYRHWPALLAMGAFGFTIYNLALNFGELTVPAGPASFLVATVPLLTAILAARFLHEPFSRSLALGLVLGLVGVAFIAIAEGEESTVDFGAILILAAALSQAIYFVLQRRWLTAYQPLQLTAYGVWAGTVLMLPWLPGAVRQLADAPLNATLSLVYLGLFPGVIAYVAWAHVLKATPASRAATYLYSVPVVATAIAWVWLDETPAALSLVGGALALTGVALARRSKTANRIPDDHPQVRDHEPDDPQQSINHGKASL